MIRLFLDSADIDEIRNVYSLITLDGVTTNPSILAESRNKYGSPILALKVISKFVTSHGGTLHVQPVGTSYQAILDDAHYLLEELGEETWIKIPVTEDGLAAISTLSGEGVHITAASVFSFSQGMLAYKAGAECVSVYCNRAQEHQIDYEEVIRSIKNAFADKMLLAASFKNAIQAEKATLSGADSLTLKSNVLFSDLRTNLMRKTVEDFKASWTEAFGKDRIKPE